jgi:hypothetical protein
MNFASINQATATLSGKQAPKTDVKRVAEIIQRLPPNAMPINAPSQRSETHNPSNKEMTSIQQAFVAAVKRNKTENKTTSGASSWVGKAFG